MNYVSVRKLAGVLFFTFVLQQGLFAQSCPESEKMDERVSGGGDVFSGPVRTERISKNGKKYLRASVNTTLPYLTRLRFTLFYVRGTPPVEHLAYRKTVRADRQGDVEADLLGLERSIWAGCYRLVVRFDPNNQVPSVRKKLQKNRDMVELENNWFEGTSELLEQQKRKAVERARRDYRRLLSLADDVKQMLITYRKNGHPEYTTVLFFPVFRLPQYWIAWTADWRSELNRLKASNEKRPRFDGRTVPYHYVEDRTAYFLQYDIQHLEKLLELANRRIWRNRYTMKQVQDFREQYRKVRQSAANTMTLLDLVVPLSKKQRKTLRSQLKQLTSLFEDLKQSTNQEGGPPKSEKWKKRLNETLTSIQKVIFQVDSDIQDVVYRKLLRLSKQLQQFSSRMYEMEPDRVRTKIQEFHRLFQDTRELARSFLNSNFR